MEVFQVVGHRRYLRLNFRCYEIIRIKPLNVPRRKLRKVLFRLIQVIMAIVKHVIFCSYRGVCQFDIDFLGNQPRILAKMKKKMH